MMMSFVKGLIARFSSRKFLVAVTAIAYAVYTNDHNLIAITVAGYLAAEGLPDAVTRFAGEKTAQGLLNLKKEAVKTLDGQYLPTELEDGRVNRSGPATVAGDYQAE